MGEMATGFMMPPMDGAQKNENWTCMDSTWMLLLIASMFGGNEYKDAMIKAVEDKAKEAINNAKQSVQQIEHPADAE